MTGHVADRYRAEGMTLWIAAMQGYAVTRPHLGHLRLDAAKESYVSGRITIGEFEARVDAILRHG